MKKVLLSVLFIGLTLTAFCQKKETRSVSGFTGIDASSAFDITVTKGNTESLVIEADDDIMQYVRSEVKNGVLHLYISKEKNIKNIKVLKAGIVMKNLDKVSLSGACKLSSNDLFTPDYFKGDCSGASKITLNLNTTRMDIDVSGACAINLKADVAKDAKFDMSGASKMQLQLKATDVKFDASGVSNINVDGSATTLSLDLSGTSKIEATDFVVKSASIESSGTSKASLHVTEKLKVNSSGASTVNYKGSPSIESNNSGASSIRSI